MEQDGAGSWREAANTEADTTSGAAAPPAAAENRGGEAGSTGEAPPSPNGKEKAGAPAKPKAKTVLGTSQERLEILQDAAKMLQQAGATLRVGWTDNNGTPTIVLAIPNAVIQDNLWILIEQPKAKGPDHA